MRCAGRPAASSGGAAGTDGVHGQPWAQATEASKDERFGVTRRSVAGTAGRCRNRATGECIGRHYLEPKLRGIPVVDAPGGAEGYELRGDSEGDRRQGRKVQKLEATPGCIERRNGRNRTAGKLEVRKPPGALIGCGIRGNSELHRRQTRRRDGAGQLAVASGGVIGRARRGRPQFSAGGVRRM